MRPLFTWLIFCTLALLNLSVGNHNTGAAMIVLGMVCSLLEVIVNAIFTHDQESTR